MPEPKRSPDGPASAPAATPETLAAILADYRADIPAMTSSELPHPTPEYLRILLDRIEAAAERERIELREDEAKMLLREYAAAPDESLTPPALKLKRELLRLAPAPGNAAAMRAALEKLDIDAHDMRYSAKFRNKIESQNFVERVVSAIRAATSAPARNCDRYASAKDALDAFIREKEIKSADVDNMNLRDFFDWLFDMVEKGGAK